MSKSEDRESACFNPCLNQEKNRQLKICFWKVSGKDMGK